MDNMDALRYTFECIDHITPAHKSTLKGISDIMDKYTSTGKTVKNRKHYKRNGIEVKDVISDIFTFYGDDLSSNEAAYIFNIVKYLMRYKYKGNPKKDLDKATTYLEYLKEEIKCTC